MLHVRLRAQKNFELASGAVLLFMMKRNKKTVYVGILFVGISGALFASVKYVTTRIERHITESNLDRKLQQNTGCIPITSLPADIQAPGIYCLSGNLKNPNEKRDSITIFTDGVTINGNGFCIEGSTTPTALHSGLRAIDRKHLSLQNMCIIGHKTGILVGDTKDTYTANFKDYGIRSFRTSSFISITHSSLSRQTFQGIHVRGSDITINANSVEHIGGTQGENPFATGIYVSAVNCDISDNRIFDLRPSGNGEGVGIALYSGAGCKITKNLVDPFRTTEHGRTFGIWSKSVKNDTALFLENTVINADYSFGPFGYYKNNSAVDSACGVFVNRTFSLPPEALGGWLSTENNTHVKTPRIRKCRDDLRTAISAAKSNLNKHTAYSVVLAYAEADPIKYAAEQLAWIMLAADLKHETAVSIISSSPTAGRTQETYIKAKAHYSALTKENYELSYN